MVQTILGDGLAMLLRGNSRIIMAICKKTVCGIGRPAINASANYGAHLYVLWARDYIHDIVRDVLCVQWHNPLRALALSAPVRGAELWAVEKDCRLGHQMVPLRAMIQFDRAIM